jgi:diguanylate cyclase (GGDEF)-like protein
LRRRRGSWSFFLIFGAYLGLCVLLLGAPRHGAALFPLAGALLVLVGWVMGAGVAGLLTLLTCMVALALWNQFPPDARLFILLQLPAFWAALYFLRENEHRWFLRRQEQETALSAWRRKTADWKRDIDFFQRRVDDLKTKSLQRQNLAACAKDLGAALDSGAIQDRLLDWTRKTFPDAHSVLSGLSHADPVDAWVLQRRQGLLCEDLSARSLFRGARVEPGTKSLAVAPLWVDSQIIGGLRVESPAPRRFGQDDFRVLDALATLASLALDNAALYHRVEQSAVRDGLTQLLTHRAFEERLQEELLRAARYRLSMTLLMVDVDHFKGVNDTHGHPAGDEVLRRVSRLLAAAARPVDVAARYGGEEFALLLVEMEKAEAIRVAEAFRKALAAETFQGRAPFRVTVSIGAAVCPAEAASPQQLVRVADQRLYRAKREGRDRVVSEG